MHALQLEMYERPLPYRCGISLVFFVSQPAYHGRELEEKKPLLFCPKLTDTQPHSEPGAILHDLNARTENESLILDKGEWFPLQGNVCKWHWGNMHQA